MAHYGRLGNFQFAEAADDIRGSSLYGQDDEKLGKIADVIFDHGTGDIGYVVVDTGGWLKTKDFLVPANRIQASAKHEKDFASVLTKQQVESFPPYNPKDLESERLRGPLPLEMVHRSGDASRGNGSEHHPDHAANGRKSVFRSGCRHSAKGSDRQCGTR
jgi:sporulation protein YlmC with PRC-barrel domain